MIDLFGFPVVEVDNLLGLGDAKLDIVFERDVIASALRERFRAPTIAELKVLSRKYRNFMRYRRRYARGARK